MGKGQLPPAYNRRQWCLKTVERPVTLNLCWCLLAIGGITLLLDRPRKNSPPDGTVLLKLLSQSLVADLDVVYTNGNKDLIETWSLVW